MRFSAPTGPDGATQLRFSAATDAGGRQTHIALTAPTRAHVDHARTLATEILHEPRDWPEYHPGYYAVFMRDPAGNNVEIVHHGSPPGP
jgi:predicted lactoylglutathione lyase